MKFTKNDAEFYTVNMEEMKDFLREREENSRWYTDENDTRAADIRFQTVFNEPISIAANVKQLSSSVLPKFKASEEAYAETMFSPEYGYFGTSQMMFVKGDLIPIGNSAIKGLLNLVGLVRERFYKLKKEAPKSLSQVMDYTAQVLKTKANILVRDEMIRAINGGQYAVYPMDSLLEETENWMKTVRPAAVFTEGYFSQEHTRWEVDMSAYQQEILGAYPNLLAANFMPSLLVRTSHNGSQEVGMTPALKTKTFTIPLGVSLEEKHLKAGSATQRTSLMNQAIQENFANLDACFGRGLKQIEDLRDIKVSNAYSALIRGMRKLGLPQKQALESAEAFECFYPNQATAYDCYMAVADTLSFILRDFPNDERKRLDGSLAMCKAAFVRWSELGSIPGKATW